MKIEYINSVEKIGELSEKEKLKLKEVTQKYKFRSNSYYLSLINWKDKNDPIRNIIIPHYDELNDWGYEDPSSENSYTVSKGLQHKYNDTALLLVNNVCGGICRFCFRKRLFTNNNNETIKLREISEDIEYIKNHSEITNVLLTGGDPMILSTQILKEITEKIREINHVKIIRIGTKLLAYNPYRFIEDESLMKMISENSSINQKIYIMADYNSERELTETSLKAVYMLQKAGATILNQTPILKTVNATKKQLSALFKKLSFNGIAPYYVFQNRPVMGNQPFSLPLEEAYSVFLQSLEGISGVAKRPKFVMSHRTGKIEITGITSDKILFRYHRSHNPDNYGKIFVYERNDKAYWFDDYKKPVEIYKY